jgi:hypothetical protein
MPDERQAMLNDAPSSESEDGCAWTTERLARRTVSLVQS